MNNTQTPQQQGAELRREVRAAIADGDANRTAKAQTNYSQWNDQWKATNAEAIAEANQKRKAKDEATIDDQADVDEVASQSIQAASVMLRLEEKSRKKDAKIVDLSEARQQAEHTTRKTEVEKARIAADAEAQRQRADRAEADRYERHQQTFKAFEDSDLAGKPEGYVYTVENFLKAFEVPNKNRKTITDALTKWAQRCSKRPNREPRQKWKLDREQAQLFYEDYIGDVRHQKRHAVRTKVNSPRIAQDT